MAIKRFEDVRAWQATRELTKLIYELCKQSPDFRHDRRLRDQIQAAAVSIMSNVAEGFGRRSGKEFIQFLFTAKASAAEVQSLLYVALDQEYVTHPDFTKLYEKADEIAKIISGFITSLLRGSR